MAPQPKLVDLISPSKKAIGTTVRGLEQSTGGSNPTPIYFDEFEIQFKSLLTMHLIEESLLGAHFLRRDVEDTGSCDVDKTGIALVIQFI